ncbi:GntR family transcriptional regulator [Diaminobutyricibacter tongyongensis]|uniref:GntR family transcriptional regulator n=1 Tax=Leifsonia tongyongensis TaxID=1268043 RepID=A0A6L9Y2X1_9MICO|nr:GntR family transcriptional regulator [Diaminobutyricibacter tongyongensis]NEN08009.1 GntR family transcriptional regulator [Diaminobutyricibacter tongyongensis]
MPVPTTESVTPRRLIRDEVFLRLLDAIVDGDLAPGEQLHDSEIEEWVGVSRTPVREALNQLAAMGLVEVLPQKRTRVAPIDIARLRGLVETLGALYVSVVRDTVPLLTAGDLSELEAFAERADADERTGVSEDIRQSHLTDSLLNIYVRRLDNKTIARLTTRHVPELSRALKATPSLRGFQLGAPIIREIVDASRRGDANAAADGVRRYWDVALTALVDDLAESVADTAPKAG